MQPEHVGAEASDRRGEERAAVRLVVNRAVVVDVVNTEIVGGGAKGQRRRRQA